PRFHLSANIGIANRDKAWPGRAGGTRVVISLQQRHGPGTASGWGQVRSSWRGRSNGTLRGIQPVDKVILPGCRASTQAESKLFPDRSAPATPRIFNRTRENSMTNRLHRVYY